MSTEEKEMQNEELETTPIADSQSVDNEASEEATKEIDPLAEAQAKIEELQLQMLYRQAEFENYRKRVIKEKADLLLNGAEKTVLAMLPVLDDFERAMQNMAKAEDVEAVRQGVELIQQKFAKALEGLGVKPMDTTGALFSTDLHEAIAQVPAPNDDMKGKVIDCVQTGYTLNDKVIRFAKVAVGV